MIRWVHGHETTTPGVKQKDRRYRRTLRDWYHLKHAKWLHCYLHKYCNCTSKLTLPACIWHPCTSTRRGTRFRWRPTQRSAANTISAPADRRWLDSRWIYWWRCAYWCLRRQQCIPARCQPSRRKSVEWRKKQNISKSTIPEFLAHITSRKWNKFPVYQASIAARANNFNRKDWKYNSFLIVYCTVSLYAHCVQRTHHNIIENQFCRTLRLPCYRDFFRVSFRYFIAALISNIIIIINPIRKRANDRLSLVMILWAM